MDNSSLRRMWPRVCVVLGVMCLAAGLGYQPLTSFGGEPPAVSSVATSDTELLAWKFRVHDGFHIQHQTITTVTGEQRETYRNQVLYDYQWRVVSVDSKGSALISVVPSRVRLRYESLSGQFDSDRAGPSESGGGSASWKTIVNAARQWTAGSLTFRTDWLGRVDVMEAMLPSVDGSASSAFTPAAWGSLTGLSPRVGMKWSRPMHRPERDEVVQVNRCEITAQNLVDCHMVYRIEGITSSRRRGEGDLGPTITIGHFDAAAGHYLDYVQIASAGSVAATGKTPLVRVWKKWTIRRIANEQVGP